MGRVPGGLSSAPSQSCLPPPGLRVAPSLPAVAGLGFGLMSGAFSMINLLADSIGPGTVGIHGDSQLYFLTSGETPPAAATLPPPAWPACLSSPAFSPAAFMTLVLILLHTFWGVIFFHGCENRRWWEVGAVVLTHLIVSVLVSGRSAAESGEGGRAGKIRGPRVVLAPLLC